MGEGIHLASEHTFSRWGGVEANRGVGQEKYEDCEPRGEWDGGRRSNMPLDTNPDVLSDGNAVGQCVKRCPSCSVLLPVDRYYADQSRPDGLERTCRSCSNQARTERARRRRAALREGFEARCLVCRGTERLGLHATDGEPVGLICRACSSGLGALGHDEQRLRNALLLVTVGSGEQRCTTCERTLPLSTGFARNASRATGFEPSCRGCNAARLREFRRKRRRELEAV